MIMQLSRKTMHVVLLSIMSLVAVPAVRADDIIQVTGIIVEVDLSIIVVEPEDGGNDIIIHGFPFENLEAQLDERLDPLDPDADGITIKKDDCVTVDYYEKENGLGDVFNKFESLTEYCQECTESCYDGDALARKPQQTNRPFEWPGQGKPEPPGKALGLSR
jgi:hypothetical protein